MPIPNALYPPYSLNPTDGSGFSPLDWQNAQNGPTLQGAPPNVGALPQRRAVHGFVGFGQRPQRRTAAGVVRAGTAGRWH